MEVKKSQKADLENKRGTFIQIGLFLSLLIVVGLFSWSQGTKTVQAMATSTEVVEQDVMEVTVQEEKQPEPVKLQSGALSDIVQIVKNDTKIDQQALIFDDADVDFSGFEIKKGVQKEATVEEELPELVAEEEPKFKGGSLQEFRKWVNEDLPYPPMAQDNNITGKVVMTFVIEKDGRLTNVQLSRSPNEDLTEAAIKRVASSPKWTPAKNHGKPVRFKYTFTVDFILN